MYRIANEFWEGGVFRGKPKIVVVGCGGTGAFVAEGLCRLLGDRPASVILVDHDRVEEHNLRRQAFYGADLGRFKVEVLAERLSRNFGREIGYSVYPYTPDLHLALFDYGKRGMVIGCVDNAAARRAIAQCIDGSQWWLDVGNSEHSGQVLIGNTAKESYLKEGFVEELELCTKLPLPSMQQPGLLIPAPEPTPQPDCAEAVRAGQQSPTINQVMAGLTLEFVSRFLSGTLTYLAAYIDLEVGTLRPVLVEPKTVARMAGIPVNQLMAKKEGGRHVKTKGSLG